MQIIERISGALLLSIAVLAQPGLGHARVARLTIEATESAKKVEGAPDYEVVSGIFAGELDPDDPHNRIITDLDAAPRNSRGLVEYRATFQLARPLDPTKSSGVLFYDVPNRGYGFVSADPAGHVRVVSGWQGDIPAAKGLQTALVPTAVGHRGTPITGPVLARFTNIRAGATSIAIAGGIGMPVPRPIPTSLDASKAQLWREDRGGDRVLIPSDAWAFAGCKTQAFPGTPNPGQLCLRDGFDQNVAYTLVYEGKDPLVLGIGFAATRDLVSFLRSGRPDDAGTPNPAGMRVRWTVASGTSQSGNFLRSFVHLGFNADEASARVFDGINPNIAARQVPLNVRFGVPGGAARAYEPGSEGTLWWGRYDDKMRGRGASSLLDRCSRSRTCPKIIETVGSAEFWGLRLSPNFVGTDARRDIPLPANVRRYYFPSTAHGGSYGKGFVPEGDPRPATCLLRGNPNPSLPQLRVAQKALVDWVREGKMPPASRYPTLARGELVAPTAGVLGWPKIPGAPTPTGKINPFVDQDFGDGFQANDLSGTTKNQPPVVSRQFTSLVPRLNADGNETSGVPSVFLQVPLGTYTGWNVETQGIGAGGGCAFDAGFIPFLKTRAERLSNGDPRRSLEERYTSHLGFVARVREVVAHELAEGWLLPDDAANIVKDAKASGVLK